MRALVARPTPLTDADRKFSLRHRRFFKGQGFAFW